MIFILGFLAEIITQYCNPVNGWFLVKRHIYFKSVI